MRKLLIHIGRHKTGTTAIQNFLQDNQGRLSELGYLVPQSGRLKDAHHYFARPFQPRNSAQLAGVEDYRALEPFQDLEKELAGHDPRSTAVLSSEGFQNCKPELVREAFRDYRVQIVVYLRNQLEYLASAYAQRVHATDYTGSLGEFYKSVHRKGSNYATFLDAWSTQFSDPLIVRRYTGAVIEDFLTGVLKIPQTGFIYRQEQSNPSLNSVVTEFKRMLNRRPPDGAPAQSDMYPALPKLNGLFPGPKYAIPSETAEELLAQCQDSDKKVARKYFDEEQLFDYSGFCEHPVAVVSDNQFDAMYAAMLSIMAEADTNPRTNAEIS